VIVVTVVSFLAKSPPLGLTGKANNLLTCLSVTNSDVAKNSTQSLAIVADREF